jgi:hypothetical protein
MINESSCFEGGTWWQEIPSPEESKKLLSIDRPVISRAYIAEKEMRKKHSKEYSDLCESLRVKYKDYDEYLKIFTPLCNDLLSKQAEEISRLPQRCFHSYWRDHVGYWDNEKYGCICDPLEIEEVKMMLEEKNKKYLERLDEISGPDHICSEEIGRITGE